MFYNDVLKDFDTVDIVIFLRKASSLGIRKEWIYTF